MGLKSRGKMSRETMNTVDGVRKTRQNMDRRDKSKTMEEWMIDIFISYSTLKKRKKYK
jgi:hypothetical protein